MDRGVSWATVPGVTKSQIQQHTPSAHTHTHTHTRHSSFLVVSLEFSTYCVVSSANSGSFAFSFSNLLFQFGFLLFLFLLWFLWQGFIKLCWIKVVKDPLTYPDGAPEVLFIWGQKTNLGWENLASWAIRAMLLFRSDRYISLLFRFHWKKQDTQEILIFIEQRSAILLLGEEVNT